MSENKLMSMAFGSGRRKVNKVRRKVHKEAINNSHSSQNTTRMNKSKRMKQSIWQARET